VVRAEMHDTVDSTSDNELTSQRTVVDCCDRKHFVVVYLKGFQEDDWPWQGRQHLYMERKSIVAEGNGTNRMELHCQSVQPTFTCEEDNTTQHTPCSTNK